MKLDTKTIGKIDTNPIFKGLPDALKDPKVYKKIEKELFDALESPHNHKKPSVWLKCGECQQRVKNRRIMMKTFGFKSLQQYMEWRKVMDVITNQRNINI